MFRKLEEKIKLDWKGNISNPLVSICCITYNHEKFIAEALDSFLMQETDFPFEIVIGDDCSNDGTPGIINDYMSRYPSIIHLVAGEHNVGMHKNYDRVIAAAQGEFIAFCEGDDFFTTKEKLMMDIKKMKDNPDLSFIFGPAIQVNEKNDDKRIRNRYSEKEISEINLEWVLKKGGAFYPTPTCFYKKSILSEKPRWFNLHSTVDYPLAILAVLKGGIGYIEQATACYRVHEGGISNKKFLCRDECVGVATNKYQKNLNFIKVLHEEGIARGGVHNALIAKEDYVYYSKLIDCGRRISTLVGLFKVRYSLYYKLRLVVKLIYKIIR